MLTTNLNEGNTPQTNIPSELIPPNTSYTLNVSEKDDGIRLDKFMADSFTFYSRSFLKRLVGQKHVTVNNKNAKKPSLPLCTNDVVVVYFPKEKLPEPALITAKEFKDIEIVYEHEHFLIIFKPAGLVVHRPHSLNPTPSLVDWLVLKHEEIAHVGTIDRPGIVHRLDKDTSGLLIIARTNYAHKIFSDMFKERKVKKTYVAVVNGYPENSGSIDYSIGRHPTHRLKMKTFAAKEANEKQYIRTALTHYKVLKHLNGGSLVEVKIITGRTHQIRVHFTALGHPLLGDPIYGQKSKLINRQALHAKEIAFTFQEKEYSFSRELPKDLETLLIKVKL